MECCHWDGDHANNRLENLRWDTREANRADARRHGTTARGESCRQSSLTEDDVRRIRASSSTQKELAREFGVSGPTISHIRSGKTWRHVV